MLAFTNGAVDTANLLAALAVIAAAVAAVAYYFAPQHRGPRILVACAVALVAASLVAA